MDNEFEGSLVLEQLAEIGEVDAFFDAVDSDDFNRCRSLMEKADINEETILIVLKELKESTE